MFKKSLSTQYKLVIQLKKKLIIRIRVTIYIKQYYKSYFEVLRCSEKTDSLRPL